MSKTNNKKIVTAPSASKSSKNAATSKPIASEKEKAPLKIETSAVSSPIEINLKAVDKLIFEDSNAKWPLIIDPNERVSAFLRHRDTNIVNAMDLQHMKGENVRVKLISALRFGKVFVIDLMDSDRTLLDNIKMVFSEISSTLFDELCTKKLLDNEKFMYLIKPEDGKDYESLYWNEDLTQKFRVVFLISNIKPSEELLKLTTAYIVA